MSETSIGISFKLREALSIQKLHPKETYEETIWRLMNVPMPDDL